MQVTSIKLNSANVKYDNSVDTEKTYDISANVNINNTEVSSINDGHVLLTDTQVAQFNWYGKNHLNVTYLNIEISLQCDITTVINEFINSVINSINIKPISI